MKPLTLLLAILLMGCQKDNLEPRPYDFGSISFEMSTPKLNVSSSKAPSCKDIEPNEVRYNLINSDGAPYTYIADLELSGGNYVSNPEETLPYGDYVINDVSLMNGNDTIFALPHQDELHLSPYWDTTLPMDITVNGPENVSGKVFCFDYMDLPPFEDIIGGSFEPIKVQSLWFNIVTPCVNRVDVEIDGIVYPSVTTFWDMFYQVAVPIEYVEMRVDAYYNDNLVQSVIFNVDNRYNPDGAITGEDVVIFDAPCP